MYQVTLYKIQTKFVRIYFSVLSQVCDWFFLITLAVIFALITISFFRDRACLVVIVFSSDIYTSAATNNGIAVE